MSQAHLLARIDKQLQKLLNGYVEAPDLVAPELGNRSGVLGGIVLAEAAFYNQTK